MTFFNNGLNYNNDDANDEDDDDNDRDSSNYDNANVNANKGTRQCIASLLPESNHCGQVLLCSNCFILQSYHALTNFVCS